MTQSIESTRPWEYSAFPVTVASTQRISPNFIRVTLLDPSLGNFAPWGLDQRIKLVLPMVDGTEPDFGLLEDPTPHPKQWYTRWKELPADRRNELRTYTPRRRSVPTRVRSMSTCSSTSRPGRLRDGL
nr:siderophore-interacting protein [Gordonia sp. LAM0048]